MVRRRIRPVGALMLARFEYCSFSHRDLVSGSTAEI